MVSLADVKRSAATLFAQGQHVPALRLYDAILAAAPLDFDARIRIADCGVALGVPAAAGVYRATGWYCLKAGHPLAALVCARVLEAHGADSSDLTAALVVNYGSESELLGKAATRIALPDPAQVIAVPDVRIAGPADVVATSLARAEHATDGVREFPAAVHPIPLLSTMSEAAFRRVLATLTLRRLPVGAHVIREGEAGESFFFVACGALREYPAAVHPIPLLSTMSEAAFRRVLATLTLRRLPAGAHVIREGEAGESFFFVAGGALRVYATDGLGRQTELARLGEAAVFGEMALLSAQPRSASVECLTEVDLLEVGRASLSALADELGAVAEALHGFTRDRLLGNLMATSPLFKPFGRMQQRDLLRRFTSHDVAPGTVVIKEGEQGRGLFVVLTGELEVSRQLADGGVPLGGLKAGDVFGEMSLLRHGPTTATIVAARPATVLFLGRDVVEKMVSGVPEIKSYLEALAEDREIDNQLSLGEDDGPADRRVLI